MIKIKLDGTKYEIPSVSELSFKDFEHKVFKDNVMKLPEYLSIFTGFGVEQLMSSEFSGLSVPSLHQMIFDVDIEKELRVGFETITFRGKVYEIKDLLINDFGKHYFFGLHFENYRAKKISFYQLSIYSIAVALSTEKDLKQVQEIYEELIEMNWREILPQGFFLLKKYLKKKEGSIKVWIHFMKILKRIRFQNKSEMKRLKLMEKKSLRNY